MPVKHAYASWAATTQNTRRHEMALFQHHFSPPASSAALALPPDEIADTLNLFSIRNHTWTIQPCSAKTGDGLQEGMSWLLNLVK